MKDLKIGQPVRVLAVTEVGYHGTYTDRVRSAVTDESDFKALVIGRRVKYVGKLSPGWRGFGEDYDPGQLRVTGSLELWEVRTGMLNKPYLVADGDLEPCEDFNFPRIALTHG